MRKTKREKFSIFNFLSVPPQQESTSSERPRETLTVAAIEPPHIETTGVKTETLIPESAVKTEATRAGPVTETKVR